jgi:hypothetical protein
MRMLDLIFPRTDLITENRTSRVHKEEQERKVVMTLTKRRDYNLRKSKARHLQSVAPLKAEKGQT